jgi:hypothetical protein
MERSSSFAIQDASSAAIRPTSIPFEFLNLFLDYQYTTRRTGSKYAPDDRILLRGRLLASSWCFGSGSLEGNGLPWLERAEGTLSVQRVALHDHVCAHTVSTRPHIAAERPTSQVMLLPLCVPRWLLARLGTTR